MLATALTLALALVVTLLAMDAILWYVRPARGGKGQAFLRLTLSATLATLATSLAALHGLGFGWPAPPLAAMLAVPTALAAGLGLPALRNRTSLGTLGWYALAPLLYGAGSSFLLPLLDPAIFRQGPAVVPWHVAVVAEPLMILVIVWDFAVTFSWGSGWPGLLALLAGGIAGGALVAIGWLLSAVHAPGTPGVLVASVWMGGVGYLIAAGGLAYWALRGAGWMPGVERPPGGWPPPRAARALPEKRARRGLLPARPARSQRG